MKRGASERNDSDEEESASKRSRTDDHPGLTPPILFSNTLNSSDNMIEDCSYWKDLFQRYAPHLFDALDLRDTTPQEMRNLYFLIRNHHQLKYYFQDVYMELNLHSFLPLLLPAIRGERRAIEEASINDYAKTELYTIAAGCGHFEVFSILNPFYKAVALTKAAMMQNTPAIQMILMNFGNEIVLAEHYQHHRPLAIHAFPIDNYRCPFQFDLTVANMAMHIAAILPNEMTFKTLLDTHPDFSENTINSVLFAADNTPDELDGIYALYTLLNHIDPRRMHFGNYWEKVRSIHPDREEIFQDPGLRCKK